MVENGVIGEVNLDLNGAIRYLNKMSLVFQGDGCACQMLAGLLVGCWLRAGPLPPTVSLASGNSQPCPPWAVGAETGTDLGTLKLGRGRNRPDTPQSTPVQGPFLWVWKPL